MVTAENAIRRKALRVKNHLKSTVGQERLSSLSLLSIESDIARKIDFDDLSECFATRKIRKGVFLQ